MSGILGMPCSLAVSSEAEGYMRFMEGKLSFFGDRSEFRKNFRQQNYCFEIGVFR